MFTALIASLLGTMTLAAIAQPVVGADVTDAEEPDMPLEPPEDVDGMIDFGGQWSDLVTGSAADDWLAGGRSCDTVEGMEGDDTLYGERGRDLLEGGEGDDLLDGGAWHDALDGGAGDDTLLGDTGMDTLVGGEGDDQLSGGEWHDVLVGGAGSDLLAGDNGNDLIYGHVPGNGDTDVTARAFHQSLEAVFDNAEDFAALTAEEQALAAEALFDANMAAHPGAVAGADGLDTLDGGNGNDTLYGGDGDWMIGGAGDDDFMVADWAAEADSTGAVIEDFGLGEDDLVVEYDASTGGLPPVIDVITLDTGDQVVTADGLTVAHLVDPVTPITVDDVLVVGLMV